MSELLTFTVAPTRTAPVEGIRAAGPHEVTDCSKCEMNINVGIFFDGTNNNRDADRPDLKHTNIVRLWETYKDKPSQGYFPIYVPGVGTEFKEIREQGTSMFGAGFGEGAEQRVLYALVALLNAIHRTACNGQPLLSYGQIAALCCTGWNPAAESDVAELAKLGLSSGMKMAGAKGNENRDDILRSLVALLQQRLRSAKPRVKECFVDVFGFSRGAAQARVFCNWLNRILTNELLAGVRMTFRFLGIMDTVASAGLIDSLKGNGHGGWAHPDHLRIVPGVLSCVHMVAMHELRKTFPLDTVTENCIMQPNCREYAYPGAHSDVGGGYLPGALGVSVGKDKFESDSLKLAQIPLNHMFECATKAGVPLKKENASEGNEFGYDAFKIALALQAAYDQFLDLATTQARPVRDWLQPYLNWRWDRRRVYAGLDHVRKASEKDRRLLLQYHNYFLADAASLEKKASLFSGRSARHDARPAGRDDSEKREALEILQIAKQTATDECMRFHGLFDGFVHDSLAGFDLHMAELSGHWRYRKGFLGSDDVRTVDAITASTSDNAA